MIYFWSQIRYQAKHRATKLKSDSSHHLESPEPHHPHKTSDNFRTSVWWSSNISGLILCYPQPLSQSLHTTGMRSNVIDWKTEAQSREYFSLTHSLKPAVKVALLLRSNRMQMWSRRWMDSSVSISPFVSTWFCKTTSGNCSCSSSFGMPVRSLTRERNSFKVKFLGKLWTISSAEQYCLRWRVMGSLSRPVGTCWPPTCNYQQQLSFTPQIKQHSWNNRDTATETKKPRSGTRLSLATQLRPRSTLRYCCTTGRLWCHHRIVFCV